MLSGRLLTKINSEAKGFLTEFKISGSTIEIYGKLSLGGW